MQLDGSSFVQGASRGIGLDLVGQLLRKRPGGRVIATCRRPADAAELQALMSEYPERLRLIELSRVAPNAIVVGLHPGTVDTDLSKPFQHNLPEKQLLPPGESVAALLQVIESLGPDDSGKIFDFRGDEITP